MAKPIVKKITPFDANLDYEIGISWMGNKAYANRIIIYHSDTLGIVYDETISSFSLTHVIPAHTLQNGHNYLVQVQILDEENIPSALSDKVLFYTFESPAFYFSNLPAEHKITNASYDVAVAYYSPDWENISSYTFYLYDSTKKELLKSAQLHDDSNLHYAYRGLENQTGYYIRCIGITVHGMPLDTGMVEIFVSYENPNTYARIYTTAKPKQGCVQITSNLIVIQYNGTDAFTYDNGMIHLENQTLYYDEGFLVENDFTLILRGMNLWQTAELLTMKNKNLGLTLSSHIYPGEKLRFKLTVPNGIGTCLLYSKEQVFENTDMVTVCIRRKNNIYELKVFIEVAYSTQGNLWYGTLRPQNGCGNYDRWIDTMNSTYMVDKNAMDTYLEPSEPVPCKLDDLWIGGE